MHLVLGVQIENLALIDYARRGSAHVDSLLENFRIPSVHEIPMISTSSRITGGEHKTPFLPAKLVYIPDSLEEQRYHSSLESLGAIAVVHERWVPHVVFVVRRVEVFSVPARWEEYLCSKTVLAREVLRYGLHSQGCLSRQVIVETIKPDGLLTKGSLSHVLGGPKGFFNIGIRKVSEQRVTSNHAEAVRESLNVLAAGEVIPIFFLESIVLARCLNSCLGRIR